MKLRLNSKVELQIDFPKVFTDFTVPPLLFVPFIENAFKHGVSYRERSYITIQMKIEGDQIHFYAENSIGKGAPAEDIQHSGIGLENVKKRLHLLFADNYNLKIDQGDTVFKVDLSIKNEKIKV